MSTARLNPNKMTASIPSRISSKFAEPTKKLRTELRRVFSDRALKITGCSQQKKIEAQQTKQPPPPPAQQQQQQQQRLPSLLANALSSTTQPMITTPVNAASTPSIIPSSTASMVNNETLNSAAAAEAANTEAVLVDVPANELVLVQRIREMYTRSLVASDTSPVMATAQAIVKLIVHFAEANKLDSKVAIHLSFSLSRNNKRTHTFNFLFVCCFRY